MKNFLGFLIIILIFSLTINKLIATEPDISADEDNQIHKDFKRVDFNYYNMKLIETVELSSADRAILKEAMLQIDKLNSSRSVKIMEDLFNSSENIRKYIVTMHFVCIKTENGWSL